MSANRHRKSKRDCTEMVSNRQSSRRTSSPQLPPQKPLLISENPHNSSPEAGLLAEMGFPAVGQALKGSFSTHTIRSLIKNLANSRKDPRDKPRRGCPWHALSSPRVFLHQCPFIRGTGWGRCSPQGAPALPWEKVTRWDTHPALSWSDTTEAAGTGGTGVTRTPQTPQKAPELGVLQRGRACRDISHCNSSLQ